MIFCQLGAQLSMSDVILYKRQNLQIELTQYIGFCTETILCRLYCQKYHEGAEISCYAPALCCVRALNRRYLNESIIAFMSET